MRQLHETDPEVANGQRWSVALPITCSPCSQAASPALGGDGGVISGLCTFMNSLELHRLLTQPPEAAHTHQTASIQEAGGQQEADL